MRRLLALAALPLMTTFASLARAQRPTSSAVDQFVRGYIARHNIPSASIAVMRDGKVLKTAGYGTANLELRVPATEHTIYEIGSMTKQFTAEAVMMLVNQGKLSLDDPISKYLPSIPAAWAPITVRQLVMHTSGLHDWEAAGDLTYHREYSDSEYIAIVGKHPLDFPPGSDWSYTNSGAALTGMIIAKVSGVPYETFVAERIFKPAGMTETRFKHPEEIVPNRSGGYVDRDGVLMNGEPLRPRIIAPNGGIMTSAVDMAKWMTALMSGKLLPFSTLKEMWAQGRTTDGKEFNGGIAWFVDDMRGHHLLLHNGSTIAGYSSVVYLYPDDRLGVVVTMNVDRWNAVNTLATRVADFYVPGLSLLGMRARTDADTAMTKRFVRMLADVANGRDCDLLDAKFRDPKGGAPRIARGFGVAGAIDSTIFLEREDLGAPGVLRFGSMTRTVYRYRIVAGKRTTYYTFELTPDGKVSRFIPEGA